MNVSVEYPGGLTSRFRPRWPRYGAALAAVLIATAFNLISWPQEASDDTHYFALIAAVLFSAFFGGLGPALFASVLGVLSSAYFQLEPRFSFQIASVAQRQRLILFLIEGIMIGILAHVISNSRERVYRPRWGWLTTPISTVAATVVKLVVFPDIGYKFPFSFFYLAVSLSAWTGGVLAGMAATFLSAFLARYYFLAPIHSFPVSDPYDAIRVGLFVTEGLVVSLVVGRAPRLRRLAAEATARARSYLDQVLRGTSDIRNVRNVSNEVLWEWDLATDQVVRTKNTRGGLVTALPAKESFSMWLGRMTPEDSARIRTILTRAVQGGRDECEYAYRVQRQDGSYAQVADHAYVVRNPSWIPVRVIGRSAEDDRTTRAREQTRFERMFEQSPAALLVTDAKMQIVVANPAACAMLRMRTGMADGIDVLAFFEVTERAGMADQFASLLRWERTSIQFEGNLIRRSGETFPARLNATLVTNFDPNSAGCFVTIEELNQAPLKPRSLDSIARSEL